MGKSLQTPQGDVSQLGILYSGTCSRKTMELPLSKHRLRGNQSVYDQGNSKRCNITQKILNIDKGVRKLESRLSNDGHIAALGEDLNSVPIIHAGQLTTVCNSSFMGSNIPRQALLLARSLLLSFSLSSLFLSYKIKIKNCLYLFDM